MKKVLLFMFFIIIAELGFATNNRDIRNNNVNVQIKHSILPMDGCILGWVDLGCGGPSVGLPCDALNWGYLTFIVWYSAVQVRGCGEDTRFSNII